MGGIEEKGLMLSERGSAVTKTLVHYQHPGSYKAQYYQVCYGSLTSILARPNTEE